MIALFGNVTLCFALFVSFMQCILPLIGQYKKNPYFLASAIPLAFAQSIFVFSAYAFLTIAFIKNDFSLRYVAENSHALLPLMYRATAVWGAHEGSILLWIVMLNAWALGFIFTKSSEKIAPLTLSFFGLLSFVFLAFLLLTSNPFLLSEGMQKGLDLNPLLQDPGFVIHPPMLYAGYVGFSAAFVMTLAAMFTNQLNASYARNTKQFAIAAWCFLTFGITLGSWWAYRVLGWGGFWFWDPVENASLLPWASGLGLIHILILVERKELFRQWAAVLAVITFCLSLLGTFLVRSGVLISAHTFASDPKRGFFLLVILALLTTLAIAIYLTRVKITHTRHALSLFSRETSLLLNSLLLSLAASIILLGTLYPLILENLGLGTLSVGAPYFNLVLAPLVIILMCIMSVAPFLNWQDNSLRDIWNKLKWRLTYSLLMSVFIIFVLTNSLHILSIAALFLSVSIIQSVMPIKRGLLGMTIAHIGFAILMIGILLSSLLSQENDVRMKVGDEATIGPYQFLFIDTSGIKASNYRGIRAAFDVTKNGRHITNLYPEKRIYTIRQMVMTHIAIDGTIFRDLYLALGQPLDNNEWSIRIYYKPFIRWIWMGGLLMMLGGILTLLKPFKRMVKYE